jgi:hypothetical protein
MVQTPDSLFQLMKNFKPVAYLELEKNLRAVYTSDLDSRKSPNLNFDEKM